MTRGRGGGHPEGLNFFLEIHVYEAVCNFLVFSDETTSWGHSVHVFAIIIINYISSNVDTTQETPITETYLFGPKIYLIWKEAGWDKKALPTPGNFCNPGPLLVGAQKLIASRIEIKQSNHLVWRLSDSVVVSSPFVRSRLFDLGQLLGLLRQLTEPQWWTITISDCVTTVTLSCYNQPQTNNLKMDHSFLT